MTRTEFIDNVNTWAELLDFCYENGCDYCDCVYDEEARDGTVNDELPEFAREYDWKELYRVLDHIPEGYDYYIRDDYSDWTGTDDGDAYFESYKSDVLAWADDSEVFEPEEDDEWDDDDDWESLFDEDSDEPCEPEEPPVEEEDFSVDALLSLCSVELARVQGGASGQNVPKFLK